MDPVEGRQETVPRLNRSDKARASFQGVLFPRAVLLIYAQPGARGKHRRLFQQLFSCRAAVRSSSLSYNLRSILNPGGQLIIRC